MLFSTACTWLIAKHISSPIQRLSKAVATENNTEIKQLCNERAYIESHDLTHQFYQTLGRLQHALLREKNFTKDLSHELRTPISILKNALALHNHGNSSGKHPELNAIEHATHKLTHTVEILLALARNENLVLEKIKLLPILEQQILDSYMAYGQAEPDIRLKVPSELTVIGNIHLVTLLIQNLINNAIHHGSHQTLVITQQDNRLIFANPISQNQSSTYLGLGHGNYLITRIAEAMEWQLNNGVIEHTYQVTITFSPS
ncbi:sensor histidine kinase (plasmid) [Pseudoalteromonas sp. T1lg65]|uniref:sensor histidine kinase n=1 Tax=Pseudoalteromonas sp. T1lg65 TaxID=2077101 RepID=UPI003F78BDEE